MEPLTPPDCDLRGLEYMPLLGAHLFGSEFNAHAKDSEWRAALTLWWAAWQQVPAGSLPDDDGALCRLADLGRDVRKWRKLRNSALHGWQKCADGRLYHAVLCKQALIAWDKRVKERDRKAAWRARRDEENQSLSQQCPVGQDGDVPWDGTGTSPGQDADVPVDGTGRDGTGQYTTKEPKGSSVARARKIPDGWRPDSGSGKTGEIQVLWGEQKFEREIERFVDYHTAKGSRMVNWQAAWRTWVGNDASFSRPQGAKGNGEEYQSW